MTTHILAFQPEPRKTHSSHLEVAGRFVTTILRFWSAGDLDRCRLCTVCTAHRDEGVCCISVAGKIEASLCPLFSTCGMREKRLPGRAESLRPKLHVK